MRRDHRSYDSLRTLLHPRTGSKQDVPHQSLNSVRRELARDAAAGRSRPANVPRTLVPSRRGAERPRALSGGDAVGEIDPTTTKVVEVYGFVGWLVSLLAYIAYLLWAFIPEDMLHQVGVTYYPGKYWAVAAPAYFFVSYALMSISYLGLNLLGTHSLDSVNTIIDSHTRHMPANLTNTTGVPECYDLPITLVNRLLFHPDSSSGAVRRDHPSRSSTAPSGPLQPSWSIGGSMSSAASSGQR